MPASSTTRAPNQSPNGMLGTRKAATYGPKYALKMPPRSLARPWSKIQTAFLLWTTLTISQSAIQWKINSSRNIDLWLDSATSKEIEQNIEKIVRISATDGILGALDPIPLDMLAVPSTPSPPVTFVARAGFPIITIPHGFYPADAPIKENDRGNLIERAPGMP